MNDQVRLTDAVINESGSGRRLRHKNVILTGAAGSIGKYITRQLLREGGRVMMTGRDQSKLDDFIEELVAQGFERDHMRC